MAPYIKKHATSCETIKIADHTFFLKMQMIHQIWPIIFWPERKTSCKKSMLPMRNMDVPCIRGIYDTFRAHNIQ